jgi:hypothetical protein
MTEGRKDNGGKPCNDECNIIGEMACPNGVMMGGVCYKRLMKACEIIGKEEVIEIAQRLVHARHKHPDNGGSRRGSFIAIDNEMDELFRAMHMETEDRQDDEALDVVVTGIRFRLGEYESSQP